MAQLPISFPSRPLRVHPPGMGGRSQLVGLLWTLTVVAGLAWLVLPPVRDLITDFRIADRVQPVAGGDLKGSCKSLLVLFMRCDATLESPARDGATRGRNVDFFYFTGFRRDYTANVVADPAQPELLSTDLAVAKLWNRVITLLVLGPLFGGIAVGLLLFARSVLGGHRATVRALSNKVLQPVLLRMDHYAVGHWVVSAPVSVDPSPAREWSVPATARPIVLDPEHRLVLGVTTLDGGVAMPLDRRLRWIGLDEQERRQLLDQLGRDPLGAWVGALDSNAAATRRASVRRQVKGMALTALALAVAGGIAAWMIFNSPGEANGGVRLQRLLEMPSVLVALGCGAIALGLLGAAGALAVRLHRMQAILR